MSFISTSFLIFLIITFIIFYIPAFKRFQTYILVIASLIFYSWDQMQLVPLLFFAVLITYLTTLEAIKRNKSIATLGVVINLAILAFFKYKFLVISRDQTQTGISTLDYLLHLPLPIGISFFIFHNISLIVDYYKYGADRKKPTFNEVVLYILFFPQLISGPITKAMSFIPQIVPKKFKEISWLQSIKLLITGFFFKLFVANNLAAVTARMDPALMNTVKGGNKLLLTFVYSGQIYADFFGYSTIALGLGLLFGYRLPINFKLPYTSKSFSDFWSRWHISLSSWLQTYLYIPLGGNRVGAFRTYINLMIVMGLGGLWHGASFSYMYWGLLHGSFLAIERLIQNYLKDKNLLDNLQNKYSQTFYTLFIFICVSFAWIFFRFEHATDAIAYLSDAFKHPLTFEPGKSKYVLILIYLLPIILQHLVVPKIKHKISFSFEAIIYALMLWFTFVEKGADTQFIYFRF